MYARACERMRQQIKKKTQHTPVVRDPLMLCAKVYCTEILRFKYRTILLYSVFHCGRVGWLVGGIIIESQFIENHFAKNIYLSSVFTVEPQVCRTGLARTRLKICRKR